MNKIDFKIKIIKGYNKKRSEKLDLFCEPSY